MAAKLGNERRCYIGTTISTGFVWLTGEQSNNMNRNGNLVEVSDKSVKWQKFIAGIKGATASVTVHADDADTQQLAAITALVNGTSVFVFVGEVGENNAPSKGDAFEAFVSAVNDTNDNNAVATRQIDLTANGAIVRYPAVTTPSA